MDGETARESRESRREVRVVLLAATFFSICNTQNTKPEEIHRSDIKHAHGHTHTHRERERERERNGVEREREGRVET